MGVTKRIYVSCPMSVPMEHLVSVSSDLRSKANKLGGYDISVISWQRGTKYGDVHKQSIIDADALVVILPDNEFALEQNRIPLGTFSEIHLAIEHNIPLYLAYKTKSLKEIGIYNAGFIPPSSGSGYEIFSGERMTRDNLFKDLAGESENKVMLYTIDELKDFISDKNESEHVICTVHDEHQWTALKKAGFFMTTQYFSNSLYYLLDIGKHAGPTRTTQLKENYPTSLLIDFYQIKDFFEPIPFDKKPLEKADLNTISTHTGTDIVTPAQADFSQYNRNILLIL